MQRPLVILSGNSNPVLARQVCACLGLPLAQALVGRFSDGEVRVELGTNVRGRDVYLLQSFSPPVNENLIECLVLVDALKRSSAYRINAVIPYYGYGRQDQKDKPRVSITAKVVADLLTVAGVHRVITIDLHAEQIQGFFNIPVEPLPGTQVLVEDLRRGLEGGEVVLAPDAGGVERARAFASRLNLDLAILDHRGAPCVPYSCIVGSVRGKRVIVLDDMVDSGRTLLRVTQGALAAGAAWVDAYCVHAILSGDAVDRLAASPLRTLVVTDTVPLSARAVECGKVRAVSIAPMLAEVVRRVHREESVSQLFRKP